jgi:hypothetical protein
VEVITKNKTLIWVNAKVFGIYFSFEEVSLWAALFRLPRGNNY